MWTDGKAVFNAADAETQRNDKKKKLGVSAF
jgi:hypothetical protein